MKKGILLYVKNKDRLNKIINRLSRVDNEENFGKGESKEIYFFTKHFNFCGYTTFIANFENVNKNTLEHGDVYDTTSDNHFDFSFKDINEKLLVIIPRMLGSIEKQLDIVADFFTHLNKNFTGIVINNPKTVIYGLRKNYLKDLEPFGINLPKTDIYDTAVKYDYLTEKYKDQKYVIKPLTGELGNSVEFLSSVNQDFLDKKKAKVGGWILQPFYDTIWQGERQYLYVNNKLSYGYLKDYVGKEENTLPRLKNIDFVKDYNNSDEDILLCEKTINILNEQLKYPTFICRFDIIDDLDSKPMILECELVNPSFRSWYLKKIATEVVDLIEELINK